MTAAIAIAFLIAPAWTEQQSGVTTRLRGVSAVSDRVAWASGSRCAAAPAGAPGKKGRIVRFTY